MEWTPLIVFGFFGQALFGLRFLVQWIHSERRKETYIPLQFWYFSIAGGVCLLIYATLKGDPVFMLGQSMGLLIYARNLVLIARQEKSVPSESVSSV